MASETITFAVRRMGAPHAQAWRCASTTSWFSAGAATCMPGQSTGASMQLSAGQHTHGADAHDRRVHAHGGKGAQGGHNGQAALLGLVAGHQHHAGRAVGGLQWPGVALREAGMDAVDAHSNGACLGSSRARLASRLGPLLAKQCAAIPHCSARAPGTHCPQWWCRPCETRGASSPASAARGRAFKRVGVCVQGGMPEGE